MRKELDAQIAATLRNANLRERRDADAKQLILKIQGLDEQRRAEVAMTIKAKAITTPPKTPSELWEAIRILFGYSLPLTSTDPEFHAPFEWFSKVFFGKVEDSVALASRGSGKTLQGSMLTSLKCAWNPGYDAVHAGGTLTQAHVASAYLNDFYNLRHFKPTFDGKPAKFSAAWNNSSIFKIVTGSMKGVSGQHPVLLTLDEIEFWDIEALIQTFEVPVNKHKHKRIWTAFSTRQRSFGCMNWLVEEAPKRGFAFFQWSVFEMMQPCITCEATDKEPHGDDAARECICPLWDACRGERAKKATGWLPLIEARKKCIRLGGPRGREWHTQGLCNRPSSHGLVLHNFEHAYKPDGNYSKWTYVPELPWYAVHDPSEGKKSVIYFLQIYEGTTYVFDELVDPLCPDVTKAKQDFYDHCLKMSYPDPAMIVVDPHRTDAVATWKAGSKSGTGIIHKYEADTPDISETTGVSQLLNKTVELLRQTICDGGNHRRLFINPDYCPYLVRATKEYHYPTDPVSNEIMSDTPDKSYSDEIDPLRYWVMYKLTKLGKSAGRVVVM